MSSNLPSVLAQFENQILSAQYPISQYWQAGVSKEYTRALFKAVGVEPPQDLLDLYAWKNGTTYEGVPVGKLSFGVNSIFLPVKQAIESYKTNQIERFYDLLLFPIFHDDTLLLNLDKEDVNYGKVYIYSPGLLILTPEIIYDSIATMFATFTHCFERKISWYDSEGFFDSDLELEWALSKVMNPTATRWNE